MILRQDQKPSLEELSHFGVRGMQWGVRKDRGGATNRQLNKASRAHERMMRNAQIDEARAKVSSGQVHSQRVAAAVQRAKDKKTLGSREARKRFRATNEKLNETIITASQLKSGREKTQAILGAFGGVAISTIVATAIKSL